MKIPGNSAGDAGSVGRGTALVAVAVLLGIIVLQATDDEERAFPHARSSRTTTTVQSGGSGPGAGDGSSEQNAKSKAKVIVLNASGRTGEAAKLTERLRSQDFTVLDPDDAERQTATKVFWKAGFEDDALTVGGAINDSGTSPPLEPLPVPSPYKEGDADIVVVIGTQTG